MKDALGRYRINVVAELTGVPAATLRAWERRYGIPTPARTASSYRLYSDVDVVAAAVKEGLDVQGISINYHSTKPEHGLLLGYAAMDDRQIVRAILALRAAFMRLDRQ